MTLRDNQFQPILAFDTSLEAEITLGNVLLRQVITGDRLKQLSPEKNAAYCYCSLRIHIVVGQIAILQLSVRLTLNPTLLLLRFKTISVCISLNKYLR